MNTERNIDENLLSDISDIFLTYGLRSTSMDDISTHLKMSKKTLYQMFKNKDDLVEQVMLFRLNPKKQSRAYKVLSEMSPIGYFFEIKKHIIEDMKTKMPSNYFDLKKYHPEVHKRILEKNDCFLRELLTEIVKKGIKIGTFRKDIRIDLNIYLIEQILRELRQLDMMENLPYSLPEIISTIIDNFILASATEEGRMEFETLKKKYVI
ncbi:MAG: TetR/AcrR family transcriptional regulator [Culturomica sp.]|nr:TetR/AcrR family transcriptional regulator [Culturomica sp.]